MKNSLHPSWPTPLLAMAPIRLRPMGWLDDLLPLRPPSLWRDRAMIARTLRWQPDLASLSWLFDAYAMLGIELPPQRIEHIVHQRTQRRGNRAGPRQFRRRAPIKRVNRSMVLPQWANPPAMRTPGPSSKSTIRQGQSLAQPQQRKRVSPPNVPNFQWQSQKNFEPSSTLMVPRIGDSPKFLEPTVQRALEVPAEKRQVIGKVEIAKPQRSPKKSPPTTQSLPQRRPVTTQPPRTDSEDQLPPK